MLDSDQAIIGTEVAGHVIGSADQIEQVVDRYKVSIGVIATPASSAQPVCDRLVAAGVTSILNFAPMVLNVPAGVDVRKVDLSIELQILAFHAQRRSVVRVAQDGKAAHRAAAADRKPAAPGSGREVQRARRPPAVGGADGAARPAVALGTADLPAANTPAAGS